MLQFYQFLKVQFPNLKSQGESLVQCPFHDDHKASLSINAGKGVFQCFACGAGGGVYDWVSLVFPQINEKERIKFMNNHGLGGYLSNGRSNGAARIGVDAQKSQFVPSEVPFELPSYLKKRGFTLNNSWHYKTPNGTRTILINARLHDEEGAKSYRPFMYNQLTATWQSKAPLKKPIYNVEKIKSQPNIIIVEGEKTADAVNAVLHNNWLAVTWYGGSGAVGAVSWEVISENAERVVLWADNDKPGAKAIDLIRKRLQNSNQQLPISIVVIEDSDKKPKGWDAADADRAEIIALVEGAEPVDSKSIILDLQDCRKKAEKSGVHVTFDDKGLFDIKAANNHFFIGFIVASEFSNIYEDCAIIFNLLNYRLEIWGTGELPKTLFDNLAPGFYQNNRSWSIGAEETILEKVALQVCAAFGSKSLNLKNCLRGIMNYAMYSNKIHPVREYLRSIDWDGKHRIKNIIGDIIPKIDPSENVDLARLMVKKFLVSAVARAIEPGCKVDHMLVLVGDEGAGKSEFFNALTPDVQWHSSSLPNMNQEKDAMQHVTSKWLVEISELASIVGAKDEIVKKFLTKAVDDYRPPYGHAILTRKRSSVFCGTANKSSNLFNRGQLRRFWVITAEGQIDVKKLIENRDQLWAEAVVLYDDGYEWWNEGGDSGNKYSEENVYFAKKLEAVKPHLKYQRRDELVDDVAAFLIENFDNERLFTASHIFEKVYCKGTGAYGDAPLITKGSFDFRQQKKIDDNLRDLGAQKKRSRIDGVRLRGWFLPNEVYTKLKNEYLDEQD